MGFFKSLLGGKPPQPPAQPPAQPPPQPPRQGPPGGRAPDEGAGRPVTPSETERGPFPKSLRLRAAFADYDLYGRWVVVTVASPADWARVRDEVCHAYYKQFGLYNLPDGTQTIRWNEATWRAVLEELEILFDPGYAGGPTPSPG